MICPRCGRLVGEAANFCGGCGLPKAEIIRINNERQQQMATPAVPPAEEMNNVDITELNATVSQLENDLNGTAPVTDYTTDTAKDTTEDVFTPSDFIQNETAQEKAAAEGNPYAGQSEYSANAPQRPQYSYTQKTESYTAPAQQPVSAWDGEDEKEEPLTTVDFIWMMLISSIPFVGLFYLIYLGFIQTESKTKASFARATFIISIFAFLMVFVFMAGLFATQIAMFY